MTQVLHPHQQPLLQKMEDGDLTMATTLPSGAGKVSLPSEIIPARQWRLEPLDVEHNKFSLEFRADRFSDDWYAYGTVSQVGKNKFTWRVLYPKYAKSGVKLNGQARSIKAAYMAAIATKMTLEGEERAREAAEMAALKAKYQAGEKSDAD